MGNLHEGNAATTASSTSFVIDTVPPVAQIAAADGEAPTGVVTDADVAAGGSVTVTVSFGEDMDTSVIPILTLAPDVTNSLAAAGVGSWTGAQTFVANYTVTDADADIDAVSIDVSGAKDVAGNLQALYTTETEFNIDTRNPDVVTYSSEIIAPNLGDGVVSDADRIVEYTVTFSEPVQSVVEGDISVTGGSLIAGTLQLPPVNDPITQVSFRVEATDNSLADLVVSVGGQVKDLNGNALDVTSSTPVAVDTVNPDAPVINVTDGHATGAQAVSGVFSVTGEVGSSIEVTLTGANSTVVKVVDGADGSAQTVTLSSQDVADLGDGTVQVSAAQTDEHGNLGASSSPVSFVLDTAAPVAGIEAEDDVASFDVVTDADADASGSVTVTVSFNEDMDTSVIPSLTLDPDVTSSLAPVEVSEGEFGEWQDDGRTFVAEYTVTDAGVDENAVRIGVSGAKDVAGNLQADYTAETEFNIALESDELRPFDYRAEPW